MSTKGKRGGIKYREKYTRNLPSVCIGPLKPYIPIGNYVSARTSSNPRGRICTREAAEQT
nr:MAG TPA: hypothetical protein [Caudoviricetes sp.]